MILQLAIASFLLSIGYLMNGIATEANVVCKAQGFIVQFAIFVCLFWIMHITLEIYLRVVFDITIHRYVVAVSVLSWTAGAVLASLPFIQDMYGPAGAWCWLRNVVGWRFGLWYGWRILSVLVFLYMIIHTEVTLRRRRQGGFNTSVTSLAVMERDMRTLRWYPIIYFIVNVFPIVNRMHNAIEGTDEQTGYNFPLLLLQTIFDPVYGGALVLTYVLDGQTRQKLNKKDVVKAFRMWKSKPTNIREYDNHGAPANISISSIETSER